MTARQDVATFRELASHEADPIRRGVAAQAMVELLIAGSAPIAAMQQVYGTDATNAALSADTTLLVPRQGGPS